MARNKSDEQALRDIIDALSESSAQSLAAGSYREQQVQEPRTPTTDPWHPASSHCGYEPEIARRPYGRTPGERVSLFAQDLLTRGTLAHGVATFLTVFVIALLVVWVTLTYLLPALRCIVMDLFAILVPVLIILFAMCLMLSSLFRR